MRKILSHILRLVGLLPLILLSIGVISTSETVYRSGVAYGLIDPVSLARYRLWSASEETYIREIEAAIENRDYAYAESLYELAQSNGHELRPELNVRETVGWVPRAADSISKVTNGFVFGNVDSGEALVGTLASDLIGVGDVRDFSIQSYKYMRGEEYDSFLLGISAAGIGLTAATIVSLGAPAAVDSGLSVLKNAYKSGRISRPLLKGLSANAVKVVDLQAMKAEWRLAGEGVDGIRHAETAIAKSIDKTALRALADDAAVAGRITQNGGIRTSLMALELAESPRELRILERLSVKFGARSGAVFKFLGRSMLRAGYFAVELAMFFASILMLPLYLLARFAMRAGIGRFVGNAALARAIGAVAKVLT